MTLAKKLCLNEYSGEDGLVKVEEHCKALGIEPEPGLHPTVVKMIKLERLR